MLYRQSRPVAPRVCYLVSDFCYRFVPEGYLVPVCSGWGSASEDCGWLHLG